MTLTSYPEWLAARNLGRGRAHLYEQWFAEQCAQGAPPDSTRHPDHHHKSGQELHAIKPVKPKPKRGTAT